MVKKCVVIEQYKWAGSWGPFKIKERCGDCDMITGLLRALMQKEFKGKPIKLEIKPWLDNWFHCALRGGFRAPLVFINGKLFSAHDVPSRDAIKKTVLRALK